MIEWVCDCCGHRVAHEDANPPQGWATVKAVVTWRNETDNSERESDQITLCNKGCKTGSLQALEARSFKILREGFNGSPRAAEK